MHYLTIAKVPFTEQFEEFAVHTSQSDADNWMDDRPRSSRAIMPVQNASAVTSAGLWMIDVMSNGLDDETAYAYVNLAVRECNSNAAIAPLRAKYNKGN